MSPLSWFRLSMLGLVGVSEGLIWSGCVGFVKLDFGVFFVYFGWCCSTRFGIFLGVPVYKAIERWLAFRHSDGVGVRILGWNEECPTSCCLVISHGFSI